MPPKSSKKIPVEKRPVGRPKGSKINLNRNQVEKLFLSGKTDKEIADFFEIARSSFVLWCKANNFSDAHKKELKAKADSDGVEVSLNKRATGFTAPDGKYYPPDPVSMIFWLKNRHPERWRDKVDHEHSGSVTINRVVFGGKT